MAIESTDEVLVNRNGVTYTQQQGEIMAKIENTDLMLVNREDVTYTVTGEEFIDSVIDPLTIDMTFGPNPPICEQDCTVTPIPVGGKAPYTINSYQWYESELSDGGFGVAIPGGDTAIYAIPFGKEGKYFGCRITVTDSRGSSATQTTYAQAAKVIEIAPIIDTVTLSETPGNASPWDSASYDVGITMAQGTQPLANAIRPYVKGSLSAVIDTDVITAVTAGGDVFYKTDTIASVGAINSVNQSEVWSSYVTGPIYSGAWPYTQAFDGNTNSASGPTSGNYLTWTPPTPIPCTNSLSYWQYLSSPEGCTIQVNGVPQVINVSGGGQRVDLNVPASGVITSIAWNRTGSSVAVDMTNLMIDGVEYVDSGVSVPSEVIGNTLTFPTDNNFDKLKVGDVVQSTSFEETFGASAGDPFYWGKNGAVFDRYVDIPVIPGTSYFTGITSPGGDDGRTEIYDGNNGMYNAWNNGAGYLGTATSVSKEAATKFIIPAGFVGNVTRLFMVNSAGSVTRGTVAFSYDGVTEYTSTDGIVNTSITGIDDTVPSIKVDGGSWYGADGTGDAGDGRYEPSQEWSDGNITETQRGIQINTIPYAFDGDLTTYMEGNNASNGGNANSSTWYITLPSAITNITAVRFYGRNYNLVSAGSNDWGTDMWLNGSRIPNPGFNGNSYGYSNRIAVTELVSFGGGTSGGATGSQGGYSFGEVQVEFNGVWVSLIDSSVPGGQGDTDITKSAAYDNVLTLASDGNLNNLEAGYAMEMSGSKIVQTSEIASVVAEPNSSTINATAAGWQEAGKAVDGDPNSQAPSNNNAEGTISFSLPLKGVTKVEAKTRFYGGGIARLYLGSNIVYETPLINDNSTLKFYTIYDGPPIEIDQYWQQMGGSTSDDFYALKINDVTVQVNSNGGSMVNDIPADTILTFNSPNPDLQYFKVGDAAEGAITQMTLTNVTDGSAMFGRWQGEQNANRSYIWEYNPPVKCSTFSFTPNGNFDGMTNSVYVNDQYVSGAYNGSTQTATVPGGELSKIEYNFNINGSGHGALLDNCRFDGKVPTELTATSFNWDLVRITKVDLSANTMFVDGGDYQAGDTITGDTYKGTGTIVEVDETNKQLKLSNVTSRWLEGYRAVTLQEVVVAKLYAVMQENTGNIISLTSLLPDFTDQVGQPPLQFQFPAVFPSGNTPSETFPFGTELCVDVEVTNPVGSAIALAENTGASLQPGFKESSGITDVSEIQINPWDQSQVWSAIPSTTDVATNVGNDIQSLFDGSLSNGPRADPSGSTGTIIFPSGTISGNVRIYTGVSGNPGNLGYKNGNTVLSVTPVNNTWVDLGNIDLTYLSFTYDGAGILFILGIELDGKLLVDTGIAGGAAVTSNQLLFADTTNLNAFEIGDAVYMCDANGDVASYTPQTSTIASVSGGTYYTKGGGVIQGGGSWPDLFNGTDSGGVYACGGTASNYAVTRWEAGGNVPVINPGGQYQVEFYIRYRDGRSYLEVNGTQRLTGETGVAPIWKSIGYEEVTSFATAQGSGCSLQAAISAVRVNGVILNDNPGVLIFESPNPDLQYFNVGDLVAEGEGGYVSTTVPEGRNYSPDNIFDGDPAVTFVQLSGAGDRQEQKWTFNPPIDHSQIELRLSTDSPGGTTGNDIIINNVAVTNQFENSLTTSGAAYNITGTGNQLQSLSLNAAQGYGGAIKLYGILINGNTYVDVPQVKGTYVISTDVSANTMTVDGNGWLGSDGSSNGGDGRYQPSQEWSSGTVTPVTSIDLNYPPSNLFNGVESLDPSDGCRAESGKTIKWTAAVPITGVETLEIGTYNNTSMTVNGQVVGAPLTMGLAIDLPKATYFPDGILTEMEWSYQPSGNNTATLTYIKVNGALLVDSSVPGDVKTKITGFNSLSGTGTFDSFNTNRVDLATSNLKWIGDNFLNETFYMKSDQLTTFMQDNPEHVAIFNAFQAAADQYPLDVNARRSSIVGAVQRLINGETLTAEESAQVLLSVAQGVNAIEPFSYDGYYPLFYTAEKAIAASPDGAYHTHQFDGTNYYMPDGGTLYHGTYVSPAQVEAQHFQANDETYSSATGHTTSPSSNNSSSY